MEEVAKALFTSTKIGILLIFLTWTVQAQKLPSIQTATVNAPKDIKIDGRPAEWPSFEAYNNAVECYYTISNDAENLYLVVQATDHSIIQKLVAGGITLTIKNVDKKSTIMPVSLTYPLVPPMYSPGVSYTLRSNKTLSDSQLSALNTQVSGHIKEIPVVGAKGIADSVISIYNDLGIKAAGLIDLKKAYTCEIAIPLKYIDQLFDASGSFRYRLQLNGLDTSGKDGTIVVGGHSSDPLESAVSHDSSIFLISPTYLQGTYTLAR